MEWAQGGNEREKVERRGDSEGWKRKRGGKWYGKRRRKKEGKDDSTHSEISLVSYLTGSWVVSLPGDMFWALNGSVSLP